MSTTHIFNTNGTGTVAIKSMAGANGNPIRRGVEDTQAEGIMRKWQQPEEKARNKPRDEHCCEEGQKGTWVRVLNAGNIVFSYCPGMWWAMLT